MKKQTKNLLVGAGIAAASAAVAAVTTHGITKNLVNFALDRDEPKTMGKIRKRIATTHVDGGIREAITNAAEKLESVGCETVELLSSDGQKLIGHWRPCQEPQRIILAMHGWRSSWSADFGAIADFWYESGCSVLYVEQRGQNASEGEYMGMGMLEQYDCQAWVQWLSKTHGTELPMYLAGVSMGATTVLLASGLELPENVRGIIADCGFTSPHDIWGHIVKDTLHLPYGLHSKDASSLCEKKIQMATTDFSTVEVLKACTIPVLFVHGTADQVVPVEMSYKNFEACAAPKQIFIVPDAGHGASYFVNREGYESMLKGFWKEYDQPEEMSQDENGADT